MPPNFLYYSFTHYASYVLRLTDTYSLLSILKRSLNLGFNSVKYKDFEFIFLGIPALITFTVLHRGALFENDQENEAQKYQSYCHYMVY